MRLLNYTYKAAFANKTSSDYVKFENETAPAVLNALQTNLPAVAAVEVFSITKNDGNLLIDFLIIVEKKEGSPTADHIQKYFMEHVKNGTFKNMSADPTSSISAEGKKTTRWVP